MSEASDLDDFLELEFTDDEFDELDLLLLELHPEYDNSDEEIEMYDHYMNQYEVLVKMRVWLKNNDNS